MMKLDSLGAPVWGRDGDNYDDEAHLLTLLVLQCGCNDDNDDDDDDDDDYNSNDDDEAHLLTLWVLQCGGAMMAGTQLREAR